ncbi:MAG: hypothetical protein OXH08_13905, partial [Gammaproteobacteria bacterium]|nr:hypothetical protein [Gammaproteobacteria bacterium]
AGQKQSLFAAGVARTVQGQLAFEPSARPELEATVSRLDIDFAGLYRPDADLFWNRLTKAKILEIASSILGPDWAAARAKSKKSVLVSSMARAFAADDEQASHIPAAARAAALKWTPPGFRPFDAGEAESATEAADTAAESTDPVGSQKNGEDAAAPPDGSDSPEDPRRAAANGEDIHSPDAPATEVPEFLRVSP